MTGKIAVDLDIDGYDVKVKIPIETIRSRIEYFERERYGEFNAHGVSHFDFSSLVSLEVRPTDEKWEELADKGFEE